MSISKRGNEYASELRSGRLYDKCPKAVFAAVAVSLLTQGGDYLDEANLRILREWWALYLAGIVPQKPCFPNPEDNEQ